MEICYRVGDATAPAAEGSKIIAHICNDQGAWGKGFVLALSRRWKQPADVFKVWFKEKNRIELGEVQFVQVEADVWVANMIAQHGLKPQNDVPPIRYDAVRACLEKVASKAKELEATVHMPRIGCGLAGGEWSRIEPIVVDALCEQGIAVTVYDLE
ncbi:MAG: Appr-1-p processing protein [Gemmatales bacterium]|nr:MAG: Appr-1-p processing protein [Gemmatales bacterium]